jgi:hypothetical protein
MTRNSQRAARLAAPWRHRRVIAAASGVLAAGALLGAPLARSADAPVGLGTAAGFAVLAGSAVTNTGPSVISGSVGEAPGSAVSGFPPGIVLNGTTQVANGVAVQAKSDLVTGYNDAAGRSATATVSGDLAGRTLTPGVYGAASTLGLSGQLTLDAQGDPNAVFIFQAGSSLIVGSGSQVNLIGGAQACDVYWQVGSSATIGTSSAFVGNILALTSITLNTGATLQGSALARNGAVTLDTNTITKATCAAASGGGTSGSGTTTSTGATTGAGSGAAGTVGGGSTRSSTGSSGAGGTATPTHPKAHKPAKPKAHKPAKPLAPSTKRPTPKHHKPVTPQPVVPTTHKPPAFTG